MQDGRDFVLVLVVDLLKNYTMISSNNKWANFRPQIQTKHIASYESIAKRFLRIHISKKQRFQLSSITLSNVSEIHIWLSIAQHYMRTTSNK